MPASCDLPSGRWATNEYQGMRNPDVEGRLNYHWIIKGKERDQCADYSRDDSGNDKARPVAHLIPLLPLLNHRILFHPVKKRQKLLRQFRWRFVKVGKRLGDVEHGIWPCDLESRSDT